MRTVNGMLLHLSLCLWSLSHQLLSLLIRLHRRSTFRLIRSLDRNPQIRDRLPAKILQPLIEGAEVFALCFGMGNDDDEHSIPSERAARHDAQAPGGNWN
jgi:hypothetical protein